MYLACVSAYPSHDIGIMTAAVADYRPAEISNQKIKKKDDDMSINLERTQDIAKALGASKRDDQVLIGFALETQNGIANAKQKVAKKNFDFIVLNSLTDKGAGFAGDTNKITIINAAGDQEAYNLKSKTEVAQDILNYLIKNSALT